MIDTWFKWVLAAIIGLVAVMLIVIAALAFNDAMWGGDRRCAVVNCVVTK